MRDCCQLKLFEFQARQIKMFLHALFDVILKSTSKNLKQKRELIRRASNKTYFAKDGAITHLALGNLNKHWGT